MSALKEHVVWFMETFIFDGQRIKVEIIRQSLGDFSKVIRFPALYGARISQAFTATDPGVKLEPEEVIMINDIEHHDSVFTDGLWMMHLIHISCLSPLRSWHTVTTIGQRSLGKA
jgi:hypothetical protein